MPQNSPLGLVLIDYQVGFNEPYFGTGEQEGVEEGTSRLLSWFRALDLPIFHVRHDSSDPASPLRAGSPGFEFFPYAKPEKNEPVITKHAHGAFQGTNLESALIAAGTLCPIFAGFTADHCVSTSVRIAHDLGFNPLVAEDAVASFSRRGSGGRIIPADLVKEVALASLRSEFAQILCVDQILLELRSWNENQNDGFIVFPDRDELHPRGRRI